MTAAAGAVLDSSRPAKIANPATRGQDGSASGSTTATPFSGNAVEQINSHLEQASTQLRIQVDAESGKTVYKVMDPVTGQVVLQMPSEQILAMAHALQTLDKSAGTSGVLMDKQG
jgi:flagellar protein FlaG